MHLPALLDGDARRVPLEAYPGLHSRELIGARSYKSDDKHKHTDDRLWARIAIVDALLEGRTRLRLRLRSSAAQRDALLDDACVTELERVPHITLVPHVPHWMRGVTNMRGDILSVIDMRSFLGLEAHTPPSARMLVVRLLDEPFAAGLLVDAVDRIVAVVGADISAPASPLTGPLAPFLSGVFLIGERLVAVLDLDRLLRSSEIRQFDEPKEAEESSC